MRDTGPTIPELQGAALHLTGLCVTLGGQARLLDVTLALPGQGVTVVLGANGAGKSVLLRALTGLIPSQGQLHWNGAPLTETLRAQLALVFQKPVLLRRSVRGNLAFVLKARGLYTQENVNELLHHVGLSYLAEAPARHLSGGEQQRLALARALALRPQALLLDEPTASLDPASTAAVEQILSNARARGMKLILVTHDLNQARRLADDIVFLHKGQVTDHMPKDAFFAGAVSAPAQAYLDGRLVV